MIPSGVARSHRMLLSDSRANVNSGSAGFAGSSTIAPMGMCLGEFKSHALSVFGDVIEHNRLGDAAAAVGEAQFEI